jgi:predicted nucleic acid-binding protein
MGKIHNISSYKPAYTDVFFFDNNVWMFLYCPIGGYEANKQRKYSAFFNELIRNKRTIFINTLILSEFSNAYLRLEFNIWRKKPENIGKDNYKKDFVDTQQFKQTVGEVKEQINNILKVTEKCSDEFTSISFNNVLANFGLNLDFNDSYYLELARKKGWKIVTDDADLKNNQSGIEIITANI